MFFLVIAICWFEEDAITGEEVGSYVWVVGSGSIEFMFEMSVVMELRNLCT